MDDISRDKRKLKNKDILCIQPKSFLGMLEEEVNEKAPDL